MFINIRPGVLDRFEQSFKLFFSSKNNFLSLIGPIFLYKLIIGIFLWNFVSYVLLGNLDLQTTDIFSSPYYIILFFFIIVGFILYITFFIGFLLTTIKTIKDILENNNVDIKKNIKYGINSIIPSFNTYWYIFAYITLWPFLFISIGGILILIGDFSSFKDFKEFGIYILGFGFLFLLFFMIYRGVKTDFSLVSAVDKNEYTKQNFIYSVKLTNGNWGRIVGNFMLVSIILSLIIGLISSVLSFFKTSIFDIIDWQKLIISYFHGGLVQNDIKIITNNILKYYNTFYLNNFLVSIVELFLDVGKMVFILIFTFIFYKRLVIEKEGIVVEKENNDLLEEKKDVLITRKEEIEL